LPTAGMTSFEPDFMLQNFACIPEFLREIGASESWLSGMANAALSLHLPVQLCMATPTDVMTAMALPAVTNFRASNDYYYGEAWDIGLSSLLIWVLGFRPSKVRAGILSHVIVLAGLCTCTTPPQHQQQNKYCKQKHTSELYHSSQSRRGSRQSRVLW